MTRSAQVRQCVDRLQVGGTNSAATPIALQERRAFIVLGGGDTWGRVAGVEAMGRAVDKASALGIGDEVVRNTTSSGALGYYAHRQATADVTYSNAANALRSGGDGRG